MDIGHSDWWYEPPKDNRQCCPRCQGEINADDVMYEIENEFICEDCMEAYIDSLSKIEIADKMGIYSTLAENLEDD